MLEILIPVLVSLIGATVSIVTARQQRKKLEAEASHIEAQGNSAIVGSAITLVAPLRAEIEALRNELETERQARRRDADDCKTAINEIGQQKNQEISLLHTEITVLRNQISNLKGQNTRLRRRVDELESKNGHGDSTFTDPPPSDDAPEDWH